MAFKLFAILQKYDFSSTFRRGQQFLLLLGLFAILQKYDFSSTFRLQCSYILLFAILQKYDFSSKSQPCLYKFNDGKCCLRYCKSTIFQANHNHFAPCSLSLWVVCDTAKVRFFKQITTSKRFSSTSRPLFAILQKYDFSSKSQPKNSLEILYSSCLRYCKSTIFQANHNLEKNGGTNDNVVCDTAKVRFFKQITTWYVVDTY